MDLDKPGLNPGWFKPRTLKKLFWDSLNWPGTESTKSKYACSAYSVPGYVLSTFYIYNISFQSSQETYKSGITATTTIILHMKKLKYREFN